MKFIPTKAELNSIKNTRIYIILEILVLLTDVYMLIKNKPLIIIVILLAVFLVILFIHLISSIIDKRKSNIPSKLEFMVEFANSIGYTNKKNIMLFSDDNCKVDKIIKRYYISGVNIKMEKEYYGRVDKNACEGLTMVTSGGSSTDYAKIDSSVYAYDTQKNNALLTSAKLIHESERYKILRLNFSKILSKDDEFHILYRENRWDGAMREEYDGIVVAEHLFYDSVSEQHVELFFLSNPSDIDCQIFEYNFSDKKILETTYQIIYEHNIAKCSIKNTSRDCIYFFMYRIN